MSYMRPRRSDLGAVDTAAPAVIVDTSDPMPPEDAGSITTTTVVPGPTPLPVNTAGTTAPAATGVSTIDWLNQQVAAIDAGLWGRPVSNSTNAAFVPESDVSTMTKVGVVSLFALAGYYLLVKSTTRRTR